MHDEVEPDVRPLAASPRPHRGRSPIRVETQELALLDAIEGGPADTVALPVWRDERPLTGLAGLVDWRTCGALSDQLRRGFFVGDAGEALLTCTPRLASAGRILVLGLGRRDVQGRADLRAVGERLFEIAAGIGARRVILGVPSARFDPSRPLALAEGVFERVLAAHDAAAGARAAPIWWAVAEPALVPYLRALV